MAKDWIQAFGKYVGLQQEESGDQAGVDNGDEY